MTDSYNTLHSSLRISGIHRNTQIIVVTMEMYLVREIKNFAHISKSTVKDVGYFNLSNRAVRQ